MKYYETLDPVERHKLILRAVATCSHFEGVDEGVKKCLENLAALEHWDKESLLEVLRGVDQETVMDILGNIEVLDAMRLAQESGEDIRPAAEFLKSIANR
jgi:hypothetical protein